VFWLLVSLVAHFKAYPLTELFSYVKLARMRGADLVPEPPREDHDDRQGDYVHELCHHEHGIADDDRMTEKER
jgi:hypothetical protein